MSRRKISVGCLHRLRLPAPGRIFLLFRRVYTVLDHRFDLLTSIGNEFSFFLMHEFLMPAWLSEEVDGLSGPRGEAVSQLQWCDICLSKDSAAFRNDYPISVRPQQLIR